MFILFGFAKLGLRCTLFIANAIRGFPDHLHVCFLYVHCTAKEAAV